MLILYSLIWVLSPILIGSVLILAAILFQWRKNPALKPLFNFKRPLWIAWFVSIMAIVIGYVGPILVHKSLIFCGFDFEKNDPKGMIYIPFILLMLAGLLSSLFSSIYCLWRMVTAILLYAREKRQNQ